MELKYLNTYQRRKGRDLFDLYMALSTTEVNPKNILDSFKVYMDFVVNTPPTQEEFIRNMEAKMNDNEFLEDIYEIILPKNAKEYNNQKAFDLVK